MKIRPARLTDVGRLSRLWFDGWQDAHSAILPKALARARTFESFEERLTDALSTVRVAAINELPLGFYMLKGDELYQFYVAAEARGTGVAYALMQDAEAALSANGVEVAWLACAIGNQRAARFYEKCQWTREGTFMSRLDTIDGPFELEVWRYEKQLSANP
jgi:ribosomal protein S18 acetylase RimI-like enzyme